MKIITWNCAGRFAETASFLFAENPDIAIIQECLKSTVSSVKPEGYEALWFGDERAKGIAVFCRTPFEISQIVSPTHKWVIPIQVTGPETFTLVAVWSCPPEKGNQRYVKLLRNALDENRHLLIEGQVVVAGDFNSNSQWDLPNSRNHENLVADLERLGLESVYHCRSQLTQGKEISYTFLQYWKKEQRTHEQWSHGATFHIDYIFVSRGWLSRIHHFEIGDCVRWGSLSDHLPLIAIFGAANS
jgi:exonuclease III